MTKDKLREKLFDTLLNGFATSPSRDWGWEAHNKKDIEKRRYELYEHIRAIVESIESLFHSSQRKELIEEIRKIDKKWVGKIKPFVRKRKCYCSWSKDGKRVGLCLACHEELSHSHNKGKKFIIKKLLQTYKRRRNDPR